MNLSKCLRILFGALILYSCTADKNLSQTTTAARISVQEARQKVLSGKALLVCAYDSDETFNKMRLEHAISLGAFNKKLDQIDKKQMIIFFCT